MYACTVTLLADCSRFIFKANALAPNWDDMRRDLLERVDSVEQICVWQRDQKIREISEQDQKPDLFSVYEKLGSEKESRTSYPIHFLGIYPQNLLLCYVVRAALGSDNALASTRKAQALATWLELFRKRLPPGDFEYGSDLKLAVAATLSTTREWCDFALGADVSAAQGQPRAVNPYLWKRWLKLAGIKPSDS